MIGIQQDGPKLSSTNSLKLHRDPTRSSRNKPLATRHCEFVAVEYSFRQRGPTFEERDFIETFLEILRAALKNPTHHAINSGVTAAKPADDLSLDPLWQRTPTWRGQRVNLPLTAQRILATLHQRAGEVVSYEELFDVVKSGRSRDNVRKHVSTIREAFKEVDENFAGIENIPMRGFRWMPSAASKKA